ncbi:MAG: efflux RND transporter periplasmic adaptor subunit [Bacteroidetes bacterium]|nr:efflux RND transporter periplasmic adaptor subunit [Bacteroidota bacterium]
MRHHLYNTIQAIILIAILSFILSLLSACNNKGPQGGWDPNAPVAVNIAPVKLQQASYTESYPGTVVALNQIELRAQVSGFVTAIYFKDGDRVHKGQQLYSIDAQLYAANYEQAKANVSVQETNLQKAQQDAERYHNLAKEDAIAKQQVDYADAALAAAKEQVEAAKAQVRGVQTSVKYTTITAPFDGTIGISQVKVGAAVTAGVTLLNTVSTDDPMAVDFSVDQQEIYRFAKLEQAGKAGDTTFSIAFGKTDVYPHHGKINFLDRAVDPQTGTLKVRLQFPNKERLLRAGMNCDVLVHNASSAPVILIPYAAVTEQLGEYFVYVAADGKASQRKVHIGTQIGTDVIVKDGLKEGESIVTDGVQKVHEGSVLQTGAPAPAAKATNPKK